MTKSLRSAGRLVYALNVRHLLALCVSIAGAVAASSALRHSLVPLLANICIVGGIVAAPIVSAVAWIGMVLPAHSLLHQVANTLFAIALIWLCLAIVGAHTQANEQHHS